MEKRIERWIDVYTTYDESEAAIIQGFLENEGIPCRIESSKVPQFPVSVGKIGEIKILVHPEDFAKAGKVMEAARAEGPEGPEGPEGKRGPS
jgi:Putative prokaryotic signal transducing protein